MLFRSTNTGSTPTSPTAPTSPATPAGSTGWQQDAIGIWYRNYDGTWPVSAWQMIDGYWYYFNEGGYRLTSQWLHHTDGNWYYLGPNGAMLTNTRTPDNLYVDANGIYVPGY